MILGDIKPELSTGFDLQTIEISKMIRGMIRGDPSLGPVLCGIQLWLTTWVDSMLLYLRDKTTELRFNA